MTSEIVKQVAYIAAELEIHQTKESLHQHLAEAAAAFNLPVYFLGIRGASRITGKPGELLITNFSPEWQNHYDSNDLHKVDPFFKRALTSWGPFRFDDVPLNEQGAAYWRELDRFNMGKGIMSSYAMLSAGFMGMVMFAGTEPVPSSTWQDKAVALTLVTSAASRAGVIVLEKGDAPNPVSDVVLSAEEREVLELIAQGLVVKKVASTMGITDRQVRYAMDRAVKKLKVKNKKEAVAEALHRGLIRKRHFGAPRFKGSV